MEEDIEEALVEEEGAVEDLGDPLENDVGLEGHLTRSGKDHQRVEHRRSVGDPGDPQESARNHPQAIPQ